MFSVVCDFCDAINSEANGAIFEGLSFTHLRMCVCGGLFVRVSVCVFMCPTPSIFKPMGQSFPAKGVEVQFVDCKINMKALLPSHSA